MNDTLVSSVLFCSVQFVRVWLVREGEKKKRMYVPGHDILHKLFGLVHHEASSMRLPRNNVLQAFLFDSFQHIVKLHWKGNYNAAPGTTSLAFGTVDLLFDITRGDTHIIAVMRFSFVLRLSCRIRLRIRARSAALLARASC